MADARPALQQSSLNGKWLDFYALLDLPASTDAETVRKRIGTCYAEASANCDHRDLQRRLYYQAMVERVLPQCRRVLLNETTRGQYDEQHALHLSNSPEALDYVSFMAGLHGTSAKPKSSKAKPEAAPTSPAESQENGPIALDFNALPEKVREEIATEINLAREVMECVATGSVFDLLPSRVVTKSESQANPGFDFSSFSQIPSKALPRNNATAATIPADFGADLFDALPSDSKASRDAKTVEFAETDASLEAPEARRAYKKSGLDPDAKLPRVRPNPVVDGVRIPGSHIIQDDLSEKVLFDAEASRARRHSSRATSKAKSNGYKPRVLIDDQSKAHGSPLFKPGQRVLSSNSRLLLAAIIGAILMFSIQHGWSTPANATVAAAPRLSVRR